MGITLTNKHNTQQGLSWLNKYLAKLNHYAEIQLQQIKLHIDGVAGHSLPIEQLQLDFRHVQGLRYQLSGALQLQQGKPTQISFISHWQGLLSKGKKGRLYIAARQLSLGQWVPHHLLVPLSKSYPINTLQGLVED